MYVRRVELKLSESDFIKMTSQFPHERAVHLNSRDSRCFLKRPKRNQPLALTSNIKVSSLITLVWVLSSPALASAQKLTPSVTDTSSTQSVTTIVAGNGKKGTRVSGTGSAGTDATLLDGTKDSETRLRELEERLLKTQERVDQLTAEVERLRAASEKPTAVKSGESNIHAVSEAAAPLPNTASNTGGEAAQTPPQVKSKTIESILPGVKLSGTVMLYSYNPLRVQGARAFFDLYSAGLNIDRDSEPLGFHVELRYRSTKFRPFFQGTSWAQEAYVKAKVPGGTLKIGRMYKQLGIFSDYSFFGDLPYFDGLKYDPEWGASYEGNNKLSKRVSFQHYAQYFRSDGRTNGSFQGRDAVSDPFAQRRNEIVLRGVPKFDLSEKVSLAVGGSFERGEVVRQFQIDNNTYLRGAGEATFKVGPATIFGEVIRQSFTGTRFGDLPKVTYTAIGGNYDFKKFSTHFNYSQGNYDAPGRRKEYIIQPGIVIPLGEGFSFYTEYNYWIVKPRPGIKTLFDRSLNLIMIYSF